MKENEFVNGKCLDIHQGGQPCTLLAQSVIHLGLPERAVPQGSCDRRRSEDLPRAASGLQSPPSAIARKASVRAGSSSSSGPTA